MGAMRALLGRLGFEVAAVSPLLMPGELCAQIHQFTNEFVDKFVN